MHTHATESDAIAAFLAAGGRITKCPPAYAAPVTGAEPLAIKSAPETSEWEQYRQEDRNKRANMAKAAQVREAIAAGTIAEPVNSAPKAKAPKAKRQNVGRAAMLAGAATMNANRERAMQARLAKVLRIIAGEWTPERIALAAFEIGMDCKNFRQWLRARGYGDKLPGQRRGRNGYVGQPVKMLLPHQIEARNAAIIREYVALAPIADICAAHDVSERNVRRIVAAAGVKPRQPTRTIGQREPTARDLKMAGMYVEGWNICQIAAAFGTTYEIARYAIARCGVKTRGNGKRGEKDGLTPPDMRGAA